MRVFWYMNHDTQTCDWNCHFLIFLLLPPLNLEWSELRTMRTLLDRRRPDTIRVFVGDNFLWSWVWPVPLSIPGGTVRGDKAIEGELLNLSTTPVKLSTQPKWQISLPVRIQVYHYWLNRIISPLFLSFPVVVVWVGLLSLSPGAFWLAITFIVRLNLFNFFN
jgi:hypothetical protein